MLTVKGVVGGEKAMPSSFALSAAAFGETPEVGYLRSSGMSALPHHRTGHHGKSRQGDDDVETDACEWELITSFS